MQVLVEKDTIFKGTRLTTVAVIGSESEIGFLKNAPDFNEYRLTNRTQCVNSMTQYDDGKYSYFVTSSNWRGVFECLNDTVNTNPVEREIVREIKRKIEQSNPVEAKYHFPMVPRSIIESYLAKGSDVLAKSILLKNLCLASGYLVRIFPEYEGLSISELAKIGTNLVKEYKNRNLFMHSFVFEELDVGTFKEFGEEKAITFRNIGEEVTQSFCFQNDVALNIAEWFRRAKESPTKDDLLVQIGCHYEEMGEFANAADTIQDVKSTVGSLLEVKADSWKTKTSFSKECLEAILNDKERKREVVDALADTVVTAIGVLYELTGDPIGVLSEVNRSNWSKFENGTPVFDENGKIKKGENYSKPDLDCFI